MNRSGMAARWLATIGLLALAAGLSRLILPGVDASALGFSHGARQADLGSLSIVAAGLMPYVSAAFLVELALLARKAWRPLRSGTMAHRAPVRRVVVALTLGLAMIQGFFLARYLQSLGSPWGDVLIDPGGRTVFVVLLSITAGTALLLAIAWGIEQRGLGNGIAVLLTLDLLTALPQLLLGLLRGVQRGEHTLIGALLPLALIAGAVVVTAWLLGRVGGAPRLPFAPVRPTAGIVPIVIAASLLQVPSTLAGFVRIPHVLILEPTDPAYRSTHLVLCIVIGVALSWAFVRRPTEEPARRAWDRTVFESMVGVAALAILGVMLQKLGVGATAIVPMVAVATALALDLHDEAAVRRAHGELLAIGQWHSVATLEALLTKLRAAGVVVHPRGANVRRLFHVFGPHVQIDLLVPPRDVERATAILVEPL